MRGLDHLQDRVAEFVRSRGWARYHTPRDVAIALSVEAGELLELFQWSETVPPDLRRRGVRAAIAEETADVAIYALCLANAVGFNLEEAVLAKLRKNARRYPRGARPSRRRLPGSRRPSQYRRG